MASRWTAGDQVLLRHIWRGKVWTAMPVTVVEDTPNLVALYLAEGTRRKIPDGRRVPPLRGDWTLTDHAWKDGHALDLVTPGAAHAVTALWAGTSAFLCWYINLQEPLRRTSLGFDTMDHLLDIVVSPDLSGWVWKDEDELEMAQAEGLISAEAARQIRAEGERVIKLVQAGSPPFSSGWEHWSPDPAWPIPDLPRGWDIVH